MFRNYFQQKKLLDGTHEELSYVSFRDLFLSFDSVYYFLFFLILQWHMNIEIFKDLTKLLANFLRINPSFMELMI